MTEDPAPYSPVSSFDSSDPPADPKACLHRVFEPAGCRTQVELAAFLGVKQSTVSDAKKRGSIPAEWLLKLLLRKGVHPVWVLTGHGPHLFSRTGQRAHSVSPPALNTIHQLLQHDISQKRDGTLQTFSVEALLQELVLRVLGLPA